MACIAGFPSRAGYLRIARQGTLAVACALLLGGCALGSGKGVGEGAGQTGTSPSHGGVPVRVEPSAAEVRAEVNAEAKAGESGSGDGRGGAPGHEETLLDTYWKLVEAGGRPVSAGERQHEPHLILHRAQNRVSVHGGCNRLSGSYQLAGERLTFGGLAGTKMACRVGLEDEARFVAALAAGAAWRITEQTLDLLDAGGGRVARFEVRHL